MTRLPGVVGHPARFSDSVLEKMAAYVYGRVLDPFAGTGRIHELADRPRLGCEPIHTVGVEIESEWARLHRRSVVGDALGLPFPDESFDCLATSPTYGNRTADHHHARDDSRRVTYRHTLGRPLHPANSGQLQWGPSYRAFHGRAWREGRRVLKAGGRLVLNVSDHVRDHEPQRVVDWHLATLASLGFDLELCQAVATPRMGFGENRRARVDHEVVAVLRKNRPEGPARPSAR